MEKRVTTTKRIGKEELTKFLARKDIVVFIPFTEDKIEGCLNIGHICASAEGITAKSARMLDELCENLTRYLNFYCERRKKNVG